MDLSPITDFFTNIKNKITNPFFGTLIIVSVARNWELVYSLFNFSNKISREDKVLFIKNYLSTKNFWEELGANLGLTIAAVLVGYLFVVIFQTLSIWIEFNLMIDMTEIAKSDKVVFKKDFDELELDRNQYAERYEEQRAKVRSYSRENDDLTARDHNSKVTIEQQIVDISDLKANANDFDSQINQKLREIEDLKFNLSITETQVKQQNERILEEAEQILTLNGNINSLQEMNNDLNNNLNIFYDEKNHLLLKIGNLETKISAYDKTVAGLNEVQNTSQKNHLDEVSKYKLSIKDLEEKLKLSNGEVESYKQQLNDSWEKYGISHLELLSKKEDLEAIELKYEKLLQFGLNQFLEKKANAIRINLMHYGNKLIVEALDKNDMPIFLDVNGLEILEPLDVFKLYIQKSGQEYSFIDSLALLENVLNSAAEKGIYFKAFDKKFFYINN